MLLSSSHPLFYWAMWAVFAKNSTYTTDKQFPSQPPPSLQPPTSALSPPPPTTTHNHHSTAPNHHCTFWQDDLACQPICHIVTVHIDSGEWLPLPPAYFFSHRSRWQPTMHERWLQMKDNGQCTGEQHVSPPLLPLSFSHTRSRGHITIGDNRWTMTMMIIELFDPPNDIAMPCHTTPNYTNDKINHHSPQMTASTDKQNQTMMSWGEQAHLPPLLISLMQKPGAMSLSAMWQPNDKWWLKFIIHCHFIVEHTTVSTPCSMFVPTHLAETQADDGSTMQWGRCNENTVSLPPSHHWFLTQNSGATSLIATWWPNDNERHSLLFYISWHHCKYPTSHICPNTPCWQQQCSNAMSHHTQQHSMPTATPNIWRQTSTIHHGSQTMASTHKWNQMTTSQGEQAHFTPTMQL